MNNKRPFRKSPSLDAHDASLALGRPLTALFREAATAARYSVVGILSTALHLAIATYLLLTFALSPFIANAGGFLGAITFSFLGQHHWAFRSPRRHSDTLPHFLFVAITAFLISNALLATLVVHAILPPLASTIIAACVIPIATFLLYRYFVFRRP